MGKIALGAFCALVVLSLLIGGGHRGAAAQTAATPANIRQTRVMGGFEAKPGAWPWQVSLFFRNSRDAFVPQCGGTLIAERWVLSAAHCFRDRQASDVMVVEGTGRIEAPLQPGTSPGRAIPVSRIVPHEAYDESRLRNDIALLELADTAAATPTSLASSADDDLETAGRIATLVGWGLLRPLGVIDGQPVDLQTGDPVSPGDSQYFTDHLMQVHIPLVDRRTCREAYADLVAAGVAIDEQVLCAGLASGGKDACRGDSGGPLLTRRPGGGYVQIGIVSWGRQCGEPGNYGVYTRIAAHAEWIQSNSGVEISPPEPAVVTPPVAEVPAVAEIAAATEADPSDGESPGELPSRPQPVAETLLAGDNPAGLDVQFAEGEMLKVGQRVHFKVTTKKPGYLALIDITPDGRMTQIFPNQRSLTTPLGKREQANFVEAGRPLVVPDRGNPYEGFEFVVDPPVGEGLLVAVLSEQPMRAIPLPEAPASIESMPEIVDYIVSLAEELTRNLVVEGKSRKRDWSVAMKHYRIEP